MTSNPLEKGIRQQVHTQKLVNKFCNLLQRTNQIGHGKGVSTTHAGKSLILDKFQGVVKVRDLIPCGYWNIERCHDIDYSNASYMKWTWYVECIVFLNQCKVALNGYALKYFMNLVVMH